jgi:hypothetical protein
MPQLTNGQKNWRCRLEKGCWENFVTNNSKVDVEFTASHFLGWNKVVPAGEHTVYVQDPAEQRIFKVVFRQQYEEVGGNLRGMRDLVSLEEIENECE